MSSASIGHSTKSMEPTRKSNDRSFTTGGDKDKALEQPATRGHHLTPQ